MAARYINDCRNPSRYNVTFDKKPGKHVFNHDTSAMILFCLYFTANFFEMMTPMSELCMFEHSAVKNLE